MTPVAQQTLDERWAKVPVAKRIFLVTAILFGATGILNTVMFIEGMTDPTASSHPWASAFGLGVAVNSFYWLFAWRKGTFAKIGQVLLAIGLMAFTFFAIYIGLQALSASAQGVSLFDT